MNKYNYKYTEKNWVPLCCIVNIEWATVMDVLKFILMVY